MASPPKSQPSDAQSPPQDAPPRTDGGLDSTADPDIDMNIDTDPKIEPETEATPPQQEEVESQEPRVPTQKDVTLQEFLSKMDDYAPIVCLRQFLHPIPLPQRFVTEAAFYQIILSSNTNVYSSHQIPDAVTQHHLLLAGLNPHTTPLPLQRLLALATQKFIADVAADAYQFSRMRANASSSSGVSGVVAGGGGAAAGGAAGPGGGGAAPAGGAGVAGGPAGEKGKGLGTMGMQRAGFGGGGSGGGQGRAVLTMEDLGCAVGEYGVNVRRGEFYR